MKITIPKDRPLTDEELDRFKVSAVQNAIAIAITAKYIKDNNFVLSPDNLIVSLESLSVMLVALSKITPIAFLEVVEQRYAFRGELTKDALSCIEGVLGSQELIRGKKEETGITPPKADSFFVFGSGTA